jgi:hypothetical protein
MSPQPHLPGPNPRPSSDDEPTLPYGIPSQQPPAYYQAPADHRPPQPNPYDAPTQQGGPTGPYGSPSYPYGPPPGYGVPPGYDVPQGFLPPPPPKRTNKPWLIAGAIALVVALAGGAGVVVLSRGGGAEDKATGAPTPTGSFTDGLTSTEPSPEPSEEPSGVPSSVPVPPPTPTEKRRTLKDVDRGIAVYDDVYVSPAKGWRKIRAAKYSATLGADGRGAVVVIVTPIGYPAAAAVPGMVGIMIDADHLAGVQKGTVKTLRPANSNIGSQAQMSFSGRFRQNGATISLAGRCTTMTGVESIHNVTVTLCVEARKDDPTAAFRDAQRMLASVARSI